MTTNDAAPPVSPRTPLSPIRERRFVLVVDDELPLLSLDERILAQENFELQFAESAEAALALLEALGRLPDLLITDFQMPGMNGRELAAELRARKPDIKVLYQTGYSDRLFGPQELLEAGTSFIEKPFSSRGLREAARMSLFDAIDPETPKA